MADNENAVTPTPENPIPDVDEIKPGIPTPAWPDEGGGGGTGGGVLKISVTVQAGGTQAVMDKTWAEINEAAFSVVVMSFAEGENTWMPVVGTDEDGELYNVTLAFPQNEGGLITFQEKDFFTNSETGYPGMPLGIPRQ